MIVFFPVRSSKYITTFISLCRISVLPTPFIYYNYLSFFFFFFLTSHWSRVLCYIFSCFISMGSNTCYRKQSFNGFHLSFSFSLISLWLKYYHVPPGHPSAVKVLIHLKTPIIEVFYLLISFC